MQKPRFVFPKLFVMIAAMSLLGSCAHKDRELSHAEMTRLDEISYPPRTKFDILTPGQAKVVAAESIDDSKIADDNAPVVVTSVPDDFYADYSWTETDKAAPATTRRMSSTPAVAVTSAPTPVPAQPLVTSTPILDDERAPASVTDADACPSPIAAPMSWALFLFGIVGGWFIRDAYVANSNKPHRVKRS